MQIFRYQDPMGRFIIAAVAFCFTGFPSIAHAQNSTAAVTGLVSDATGAKIHGAKVALADIATNFTHATISNEAGDYNFVSVPPRYTVTISAPSFQTQKIAPFEVTADQTVNINAALKVGDGNVSVTVEAVGAQVESTTSELGTPMSTSQRTIQLVALR